MYTAFKFVLTAMFIAGSPVLAQRTWIVDANNGTGTDFTQLKAAVFAANSGDRILVRPGYYDSPTVLQGMTILGTAGVVLRSSPIDVFSIRSIPAHQTVLIRNVVIEDGRRIDGAVLHLANCEGGIHLDSVSIRTVSRAPRTLLGVRITSCRHVTMNQCSSTSGLEVSASTVMFNGGNYKGIFGFSSKTHQFCWKVDATPAIIATTSRIHVSQLTVRGGEGYRGCTNVPGAEALRIVESTVTLAGATRIEAGSMSSSAAAVASYGKLVLASGVKFNTTPAYTGIWTVTKRDLPVLVTSGGKLGGTIQSQLHGKPSDVYLLFASLPSRPVPVASFGDSWLDTATLIMIRAGVHSAAGRVDIPLPVPNALAWRGVPILQQALSGTSARGFHLSNASVSVLH